jgi:hypothetical protein
MSKRAGVESEALVSHWLWTVVFAGKPSSDKQRRHINPISRNHRRPRPPADHFGEEQQPGQRQRCGEHHDHIEAGEARLDADGLDEGGQA